MSATIGVAMVPGADGVDPDSAGCIFEGGAAGQAEDAVLSGVVGGPAGVADKSAQGGAVDDRAAALGSHLGELVFHAGPHAAQVDCGHPIERLRWFVGRVTDRELDARVVEGHVEPAERIDGGGDEGGDLVLVGDVARHPEHLMPGSGQLVADDGQRCLVDVGQHHRSAGLGERAGGGQTHAGAGAGDQGDLAGEVVAWIHR
jgi:hypothetical protein